MPGPTFFNPPFSVQHPTNHSYAVGVISTNKSAYTSMGPMATQTDVMVFPLPTLPLIGIGIWTVPNRRTYVNGVATVGQASSGLALKINTVPVPAVTTIEGPIYPTVGAPRVHTR